MYRWGERNHQDEGSLDLVNSYIVAELVTEMRVEGKHPKLSRGNRHTASGRADDKKQRGTHQEMGRGML
jgi:hypothetical protein